MQLLVIEPSVKLTAKQIEKIEAAGFIVVRGDPKTFHVIRQDTAPTPNDQLVLRAALATIQHFNWSNTNQNQVRWSFGQELARQMGLDDVVKMK